MSAPATETAENPSKDVAGYTASDRARWNTYAASCLPEDADDDAAQAWASLVAVTLSLTPRAHINKISQLPPRPQKVLFSLFAARAVMALKHEDPQNESLARIESLLPDLWRRAEHNAPVAAANEAGLFDRPVDPVSEEDEDDDFSGMPADLRQHLEQVISGGAGFVQIEMSGPTPHGPKTIEHETSPFGPFVMMKGPAPQLKQTMLQRLVSRVRGLFNRNVIEDNEAIARTMMAKALGMEKSDAVAPETAADIFKEVAGLTKNVPVAQKAAPPSAFHVLGFAVGFKALGGDVPEAAITKARSVEDLAAILNDTLIAEVAGDIDAFSFRTQLHLRAFFIKEAREKSPRFRMFRPA